MTTGTDGHTAELVSSIPGTTSSMLAGLADVLLERIAQVAKWGTPDDPNDTADRADGTNMPGDRLAEQAAKDRTDAAMRRGVVTWRDILDEEVHEAFAADTDERLRAELVQVAAVAVKWVEAIDRRARP